MKQHKTLTATVRTVGHSPFLLVLGLLCSGVACVQAADDEALWKQLDITEDGWLDGKELDGGWKKYDADGDNEVTKAEFMAGRAAASPEEDTKLFKRLDISGNGLLSGKELEAGNVRTYDANGDGRVSEEEFLAARAKARGQDAAGTAGAPQNGLLQQGSTLRNKGNLDEAAFALRSTIRQNPQSSQAHYQLSLIYLKQQKDALAKASLFRALALNPADTAILNTLAASTERLAKVSLDDAYAARAQQEAEDARQGQPTTVPLSVPALKPAIVPLNVPEVKPAAPAPGGGLTTEAEILSFLKTRLGAEPLSIPYEKRHQTGKELIAMLKQRGLNFRAEVGSPFYRDLGKFGAGDSSLWFSLRDNYGPPTRQNWLMGAWNLSKIGGVVDYVVKDRVMRQNESAVGNVGTLTLNPNGTYVWQVAHADTLRGAWRKATVEEMKHQGGDGVVLLKAKGTWDWIVIQDRVTTLKDNWISILELTTRQVKESGFKKAGAQ